MANGSPAKMKGIFRSGLLDTTAFDHGASPVHNNRFTEEKQDAKDLRSNPPTKVKLPFITKPVPPPVKDKPNKVLPK